MDAGKIKSEQSLIQGEYKDDRASSSLAYSQSGAKTEVDKTISVQSVFEEKHTLTTDEKREKYEVQRSDSSSSSGGDIGNRFADSDKDNKEKEKLDINAR